MEELNTLDFDRVIATGQVVVEFYGRGCLNCRMAEPVIMDLERQNTALRFVRVNADTNLALVHRYHIAALPTLLCFNNGQVLTTISGVKPLPVLQKSLDSCYH